MMHKKLLRITTVPISLNIILKGQLAFLNNYYNIVGVASGKEELKEVSQREGIRTIHVPMCREISLLRDLWSLIILVLLFIRERPYIVHAHTPKASLLSMIAGWLTFVPHRIYTVTGLRFETATGNFRKLLITMEKITCRFATKVIPEGEGVKQTLLREKITQKPLEVILNGNINGVDTQYFARTVEIESAALELKKENRFTFCFVGRIVKDKGINELIGAFIRLYELYPQIYLFLVGNLEKDLDPVLPETEDAILNHPAIFCAGFQKDIRPYLTASDTFVFPSYREGFPNVVLQAGAMGLPSIVTDINGSNEVIKDRVNGRIIPSHNEVALFEAMKYFYENKDTTVLEMVGEARPVVMESFEQGRVWEALLYVYQSLK